MDLIGSARTLAGRAGRALLAMSNAPSASQPGRVPGVGIGIAPYPAIRPEVVDILSDRAALEALLHVGAGPQLTRYSGYYATGINPAAVDSILRQADKGITWPYADMGMQVLQRDAHLQGLDRARRVEWAGKQFRVHAAQKTPLGIGIRDFLRAVVDAIDSFDLSIYRLGSASAIGWAALETVWAWGTVRFPGPDGKTVVLRGLFPRSLEWVHPKHFWFSLDFDRPLIDLGPSGRAPLPQHKFIFIGAVGDGQYETRGYMRQAVWLHMLKQNSIRDWAVFLSLFGIPNIFAAIPRNLYENAEFKAILKAALTDYGQGIPAILPAEIQEGIEAKPGPIGSGADAAHARLVNWVNEELSKLVQSETLTTQTGGTGSYKLGDIHEAVKFGIVKMDALGVDGSIRSQLFRSAVELNLEGLCHVFGATPDDVRLAVSSCSHRIEREVTPTERARIYSLGVNELGADIEEDQFLDEYGFEKPSAGGRALRGKAIPIANGGAVVGALDAAGGVKNEQQVSAQAA